MQVAKEGSLRTTAARLGAFPSTHPHVVVVSLTMLAAGLGALRVRYRGIHFDESVSMNYARESWANLWQTITAVDPNMSLYYALLKLWTGLFGDGVPAVRSVSVLSAALCVPVVYAIGVRLFSVPAGLLAGLLVTTNVFFLRYAQEARGYALVTLLTALSTYFFLLESARPGRWSRIGYIASSTLAFYVHFFAAWVVLVHVLTLAATEGRRAVRRSWLVCYGAIAALAAPIAYRALTLDANPIGWLAAPDLGALPATFAQLAGDSFLHLGAVTALALLGLRAATRSTRFAFGLAFTAGWATIPVLLAFGVSQVKPIFLAKYLIVCLPAVALLAAGAVTTLRPVGAALAAAGVLVALSVPELWNWYGFRGQEDWRGLTTFVLDRARPTDGIVANATYAESAVAAGAKSSSKAPHVDTSIAAAATRRRVWLVLAHSQSTTQPLRSALLRHHRLESRDSFDGDIAVELYVRREP